MTDTNIPKNPQKFLCKKCYYTTSSKKDYNKHVLTLKHKNNVQILPNTDNLSQKIPHFYYRVQIAIKRIKIKQACGAIKKSVQ